MPICLKLLYFVYTSSVQHENFLLAEKTVNKGKLFGLSHIWFCSTFSWSMLWNCVFLVVIWVLWLDLGDLHFILDLLGFVVWDRVVFLTSLSLVHWLHLVPFSLFCFACAT